MKQFVVAACVLFFAQAARAEGTLYSPSLQRVLCEGLRSELREAPSFAKKCLAGSFDLKGDKSIVRQRIDGKKQIVLFRVHAAFDGATYEVLLKRRIDVTDSGKLTVGEFYFGRTVAKNESDLRVLKQSGEGEPNVAPAQTDFDLDKLPGAVTKWGEFENDPAYDVSDPEYYLVHRTANRKKVIGYLATQWYESKENDIKGLNYAWFDLTGELVDTDGESWGFYE